MSASGKPAHGGIPSATAQSHPQAPARTAIQRRQVTSADLLAGGNELQIEHHGEVYTLRQTSKGKLILTK
jgi:hemin uptake protein HemP